jgi:ComF family protein
MLCGTRAGEAIACNPCEDALPRPMPACPRCALPMEADETTCGSCLCHPPAFDAAHAAFEYRFPVDRVIQRFKFGGDLAAGRWLARQLARRVAAAPRPDVLVVPGLAPARLRARGFNQALEIARVVASLHGLRVDAHAIEKVRDTAPQPGLGGRERRANLRGAFRAARTFEGLHVALVDDVLTTGATADAVARVLKAAGARRVDAWVVARTPEPRR